MFTPHKIEDAIRLPDAHLHDGIPVRYLIRTAQDPEFQQAFKELQTIAQDIPVAVVSIHLRHLNRVIRSPMPPSQLVPEHLVPGVTAFVTAFRHNTEVGPEWLIMVVSHTPVQGGQRVDRYASKAPSASEAAPRQPRPERKLPAPPRLGEAIVPEREWKPERRKGKGKRRDRR